MAIFLKLDTIKGDATATGHAGEIAVASVSYGASRPVTLGSTGPEPGRPSVAEVTVTKTNDRASVPLTRALLANERLGMARISFSTAGAGTDKATDYFAIEMVDALVTSISATSAGDRPVDQVAFTARQMRWIDQTAGTPVSFSFDLI